jgi:2-(1,2-epoxy-1,2-dihydrophenyl)acetyl-CoA isomerase
VTRVVEAGKLAEETAALAQQLARGATSALGATRRMLVESFSNTLERQLSLESQSISEQSRGSEGREGIAAFLEKRAANFTKEG